jgi:DNA polymerase I
VRTDNEDIGITLDFKQRYDWIAFCPRRDTPGGALNRYFGKVADSEEYKLRGIEARQRSTPVHIKDCQQELLDVFDATLAPQQVIQHLQVQVNELKQGRVDPEQLVVRKRVSKEKEEYRQRNRKVAALERADRTLFDVRPGQDIRYVVIDDSKRSQDGVKLAFEDIDAYDADFYVEELIQAAESILLPLGWGRQDIEQQLSTVTDTRLVSYT